MPKRKVSTEKIIYQNISNSMTNTTNCSTTRKNNNDKININNIHIKEFSPKPPIKNNQKLKGRNLIAKLGPTLQENIFNS